MDEPRDDAQQTANAQSVAGPIVPTRSSNRGMLASMDPEPILDAINSGRSLREIAAQIGVSNVALRAWLLREDSDQYRDAITNALTTRIAEADEALDTASDAVSITRAREVGRYARMDYERRRPHLYGQRPTQIAVSGNGVTVQLVSYAAPLQADSDEPAIDGDLQRVDK